MFECLLLLVVLNVQLLNGLNEVTRVSAVHNIQTGQRVNPPLLQHPNG